MKKKHIKNIMGLTVSGILLGVGAQAVGKAGGDTSAFTGISGFMPIVGTTMGAGMAFDELKSLNPKKKRKGIFGF